MAEDDYPPAQPPIMPAGQGRRARHAVLGPMGDTQWHPDPFVNHPELAKYSMPPSYYVCSGVLGPNEGDEKFDRVTLREQLRPPPFVCKRITWATTGDIPQEGTAIPGDVFPFGNASQHGRCIQVLKWGDEFTSFNKEPGFLSTMFGDSNGFLDLPDLIIFQGSQELIVEIQRILWPFDTLEQQLPRYNVLVDVIFEGVDLLPKDGQQQSGSA